MRASPASGIAIGPILFVIAILAILATALSAGSSSFSGSSETEKARTNAGVILNYIASVRTAVARVMALGCREDQISFENPADANYPNSNAPPDKHCHIFDIAGGGLNWLSLSPSFVPTGIMRVDSNVRIAGLGTGKAALVMFISMIDTAQAPLKQLCLSINDLAGVPNNSGNVPVDSWTSGSYFTGSYNDATPTVIGDTYTPFAGKLAGCMTTSSTAAYPYFVLLVR